MVQKLQLLATNLHLDRRHVDLAIVSPKEADFRSFPSMDRALQHHPKATIEVVPLQKACWSDSVASLYWGCPEDAQQHVRRQLDSLLPLVRPLCEVGAGVSQVAVVGVGVRAASQMSFDQPIAAGLSSEPCTHESRHALRCFCHLAERGPGPVTQVVLLILVLVFPMLLLPLSARRPGVPAWRPLWRSRCSCSTMLMPFADHPGEGWPPTLQRHCCGCRAPGAIDLLVRELLAEIGHDMAQLCCTDETVSISVEHLESFNEFLFGVCVLHLPVYPGQELGEVNGAIAVRIDFIDHVLQWSARN